jgi:hypothetical protein
VKPLDRDALRARLLALAERAGARARRLQWGLGEKTTKANAALTGPAARRILVSDTMLAAFSDDEIEVVLARIAHHVHGDIWKGSRSSALIVAGFYLASRCSRDGEGRRPPRRGRRPWAAAAAAGRRRRSLVMVPAAHDVARLRAPRRSIRARPDEEPARVRLRDAPPRRRTSRRTLEGRAVAVLQPPADPDRIAAAQAFMA